MNDIIIEVGVNQGQHTKGLRRQFGVPLHGFEPVPQLQEKLKEKFRHDREIFLYPYAIDVEEGERDFHLSTNDSHTGHQYGCSSLFEFADNIHAKWPGRPDFNVGETVKVQTKRLDNFLDEKNFTGNIVYFHCDAQGNDLNVLKSLGKYIDKVQEGVIECALNIDLYKDTENSATKAQKWLIQQGFKIEQVKPDYKHAEANIRFKR